MFTLIRRAAQLAFLRAGRNAQIFYDTLYFRVVVNLVLFGLGMIFAGFIGKELVNVLLLIPAIAAVTYFAIQPYVLVMVGVVGLAVDDAFKKYKNFCVSAGLFLAAFVGATFLLPLKGNFIQSMILVAGLIGFGFWCWHYQTPVKWYRRITAWIFLAMCAVGIVAMFPSATRINLLGFDPLRAFATPPQQVAAQQILNDLEDRENAAKAREMEELRKGNLSRKDHPELVKKVYAEVRKTPRTDALKAKVVGLEKIIRVDSLAKPIEVCGLEPMQQYRFKVDGSLIVGYETSNGVEYEKRARDVSGTESVDPKGEMLPGPKNRAWALVLNKALPGDGEFESDVGGCASGEFNIPSTLKTTLILSGPTQIKINFYTGIRL